MRIEPTCVADKDEFVFRVAGILLREKRELEQADLERALKETWPLSVTMKEDIQRLRDWAKQRTRPASTGDAPSQKPAIPCSFTITVNTTHVTEFMQGKIVDAIT